MRVMTLLFAIGAKDAIRLRGSGKDVSSTTASSKEEEEEPRKQLSVWLLPPAGPIRTRLQHQINEIAAAHHHLPQFVPHVTILGGMTTTTTRSADMNPDEWAGQVLAKLRRRFSSSSLCGIPCHFKGTPRCLTKSDGSVPWNQSCVAVMKRDPAFVRAVELAHAAFQDVEAAGQKKDDGDEVFVWTTSLKPPLREPHYSLAYGNAPELCDDVQVPEDFVGSEIMLMWTDPATLEGVSSWREVGRFELC